MRQKFFAIFGALAMIFAFAVSRASAGPIVISPDTLTSLPIATFGGTGIPNDSVAVAMFTDGSATITIGLTATQRYLNPALGNDDLGTFTAQAGGDTADSNPADATWNFDFYANVTGSKLSNFDFELLFDNNPGVDTDTSAMTTWDISADPFDSMTDSQTLQNSENLGFLGFGPFDPTLNGQYSFELEAFGPGSTPFSAKKLLGDVAINVDTVGGVSTPEPPAMILLGTGLVGLGFIARKRFLV